MKKIDWILKKPLTKVFSFVVILIFSFPTNGVSQAPQLNWIEGPRTVDLGDNIAQVEITEEYVFLNGEDTRKLVEYSGDLVSSREVGSIWPRSEGKSYAIYFDYFPIGYIKDDEKGSIDSDALLESFKKGNKKQNERRKEKSFPPMNLIGWAQKPHYDDVTNNLVWSLLFEVQGTQVINYNVRLLGRHGYTSVVLASEKSSFDLDRPEFEKVLSTFSYKKGKTYAEYVQGDKLAKIGLTALVAGGAAAVAAKTGILKILLKYIKVIVIAIIGFVAALWKKIKRLFGVKEVTDVID
jgi:uncharacterized membrane-anchored protein